jgi:hypothetical protein
MRRCALDPLLVTVPNQAGKQQVAEWLTALASWALEVGDSYCEWHHFFDCTYQLVQEDAFPTVRSLTKAVQTAKSNVDPVWLSKAVNRFFQDESRSIMATLDTHGVATNHVAVTPSKFLARNHAKVQSALTDSLVCIACDKACGGGDDVGLVTLPINAKKVELKAQVALTDPDAQIANLPDPSRVGSGFPVVAAPDDFLEYVGAPAVFAGGDKVLERNLNRVAGASAIRKVVIGKQFLESVKACGLLDDLGVLSKIIRATVALATKDFNLINYHFHDIRTSTSGNAKQLVRATDGAGAWRLYLTKKGAGWRLHFWHIPPQGAKRPVIELSTVGTHSDLTIV